MNQMKRRNFLRVGLGSAAVLVAPKTFAAEKLLFFSYLPCFIFCLFCFGFLIGGIKGQFFF